MSDRLAVAAEVAERCNVPESWVRAATRDGRIPHIRLGRYVRYDLAEVEAWLEREKRTGSARRSVSHT
jgi:excisionase family DNA binding protein